MATKDEVSRIFDDALSVKAAACADAGFIASTARAAELIAKAVRSGGTVYACGNGGSACDAMHLCEELVARFKRDRPGIRAMHFMDPGIISCWSNDKDYKTAFERQASTFCTKKDVLVAISTSGSSANVLAAARAASKNGCKVIGLAGKGGGALSDECDVTIVVPQTTLTERIQEVHITVIHTWCELLETTLSVSPARRKPSVKRRSK